MTQVDDEAWRKARRLLENRQYGPAYEAFLQLARAEPENEEARLALAQACLGLDRKQDALRLYKHLALLWIAKGKIAQAIGLQKKMRLIDPNHREISELLEKSYAQAEDRQVDEWQHVQTQARQEVVRGMEESVDLGDETLELAGPDDRVTVSNQEMIYGKTKDDLQPNMEGGSGLELADASPRAFPKTLLFSDLPRGAFARMVESFVPHTYAPQNVIMRQGDPGDSLFVVSQGQLDVFREQGFERRKLGQLGPGDFFGEFGFFSRRGRDAQVVSVTASEILELRRDKVEEVIRSFPRVGDVMTQFYRQRVLMNLLLESPLFSSLADGERENLCKQFSFQALKEGEIVCREGEQTDSFYIIQRGTLEVLKKGRQEAVAELSAGDFFGEYALITGAPRSATVRALSNCDVVVMKGETFRAFLRSHPRCVEALRRIAKERLSHP